MRGFVAGKNSYLRLQLYPNRFLFLKSHNILLRIGVNRSVKIISVAGIGLSVTFAACHVVENYVFLDPTLMPGYSFFKSPTTMLKVEH